MNDAFSELRARIVDLTVALDSWVLGGAPGARAYEVSSAFGGWKVRLRADIHGLVVEETVKARKSDALASAAMIVTHNPYLE